jgi:hypothetical protein
MKYAYRRLALLTGVSVSAFAIATPALAVTRPGFEHDLADPNVTDTLTICDIGGTCDFGVTKSGAGLVTAIVNETSKGQVRQAGTATKPKGDVELVMINAGDAAVSAIASASDASGKATAFVSIAPAIEQSGFAPGDVTLDLDNDGSIEIHAVADASATMSAFAFATAFGGIQQFASSTGTGDVAIGMVNDGTILAAASAHAESTSAARATAAAVYGIGAHAVAADGDVSIQLANHGALTVSANASATGGHTADAVAIAAGGMVAFATGAGHGDASAIVTNDGSLLVVADAQAVGTTNALAIAIGVTGIYQAAHAATGDALVSLDNSGSIGIVASATATALVAQATAIGGGALFGGGVFQSAAAMDGSAHGVLDNSGDILMSANADANGSVVAYAYAYGGPGVEQLVFGTGGDATADMTNSGSILLSAKADASATDSAYATALYFNAFNNGAFANTGDAQANMVNGGTVAVDLAARAVADGTAGAHANASHMIGQFAFGFDGDAGAAFDNDGTMSIDVAATAIGGTTAFADATIAIGLYQSAFAIFGSAELDVTNDGTIAFGVEAKASGDLAFANAILQTAIVQNGFASSGDAAVAFDNQGTIEIGASASALGGTGTGDSVGEALAVVAGGIIQTGHAFGGSADLSLNNDGDIDIAALAGAHGGGATLHFGSGTSAFTVTLDASATAIVSGALVQSGGGAAADLAIANNGTILVIAAATVSGTESAAALASIDHAVVQQVSVTSAGDIAFDNDGSLELVAVASADASNDGDAPAIAAATANAMGVMQEAIATSRHFSSGSSGGSAYLDMGHNLLGPVSISLANEGDITIGAHASANGDDVAFANAAVQVANQYAVGSDVSLALSNDGTIAASAVGEAKASQSAVAQAFATGIAQFGSAQVSSLTGTITAGGSGHVHSLFAGAGPVDVSLVNSGKIDLVAAAHATATGTAIAQSRSWALAAATAVIPVGINQGALGSDVAASLTNEGSISFDASAAAHGLQSAFAHADVQGIAQGVLALGNENTVDFTASGSGTFSGGPFFAGDASVSLDNSGSLSVLALVEVDADLIAYGQAHATGVAQVARGLNASAMIANGGTITVAGSVSGVADGSVSNFAAASGFNQVAMGQDSAVASLVNSGSINVSAHAAGTAGSGKATDIAVAGGIAQDSFSVDEATSSITNSGSISVSAAAESDGGIVAFAGAYAEAISQEPLFGTLDAGLDNDGELKVLAAASAVATGAAYASANATGLHADAANIVAGIVNSGDFTVAASATADGTSGSAYAFAGGISMTAAFHGTSGAFGLISGTIENSGSFKVSAKVDAANSGTVGATATGIFLNSAQNDATIVNTGTIVVEAQTAHGAPATAYGVRLVNWFGPEADGSDVFTFTNDGGDIIVRQSVDGGDSWQRGIAVDVTAAPNPSVINLIGDGSIYGNIAIHGSDEINVEAGTTYFDGIVNPGSVPEGGVTGAALDSGLAGVGTLNVRDGGSLVLADPRFTGDAAMYDGPAYALVDTLNIADDGTLTFELEPAAVGAQAAGSYGQVFADQAHLDGTLEADVATANGLFADSYSWQNVVDANAAGGKFDQCRLGGDYAGSLFLTFGCSYDSNANVDLSLKRVAFDSVDGLGANGGSVAGALEDAYDPALTGAFGDLFADLFLMTDAGDYHDALSQLGGSAYANYLQSFTSLGVHGNDLIARGAGCDNAPLIGSALDCRTGRLRLWGQLDYQSRKADGDSEAGTTDSKRYSGLLGIDAQIGNAAIVGISAGAVANHLRDRQFGDAIDGDGAQVGLYAAYDPGAFFVKGMGSYSWLDGSATRHIDFTPLGGTIHGTPAGNPDVKMWTAGLHTGARLPVGTAAVATPYVNLDYVHASLGAFSEGGVEGANLAVAGGTSERAVVTGGVKWAAQLGKAVPELNLAYRHAFGDARAQFGAAFAADPSSPFDIVSASQSRDSLLAGASIGGRVGPVDLRVGYEGEYNGQVTSHAGNFKISLPLGGRARSGK